MLKRGIDSGEFTAPADLPALTDRTMALLDGLGLRALLHDPTMDIDAARAQVADFVAPQLGLDPAALLTTPPDRLHLRTGTPCAGCDRDVT